MIIDATDSIVGRFATVVAKKALLGEEINIINCEKAVITGKKDWIMGRFKQKRAMGAPLIGPYYPRRSDMIVKRMIRGMLPYKQKKGEIALEKIKCYIGVPKEFVEKETVKINDASVSRLPNLKYMYIGDVSKLIGAKQ